ncbi:MAG: LysM peptidoglycan-binding domain-containing protein [Albidovulum sp.]
MTNKKAEPGANHGAMMLVAGAAVGGVFAALVWLYGFPTPSEPDTPQTEVTEPALQPGEETETATVATDAGAPDMVPAEDAVENSDDSSTGQVGAEPSLVTDAPDETPAVASAPDDTSVVGTPEETAEADAALPVDETDVETTAAEPDAIEAPMAAAPTFDTVRVDATGSVLVAGKAEPAAEVLIQVDGQDASRAQANSAGDFVAFFALNPSAEPRVLTLMATAPDGTASRAEETVIVAPFDAPVVVADAAPAAPEISTAEQDVSIDSSDVEEGAGAPVKAAEPVVVAEAPSAPEVLIVDAQGVRRQASEPIEGIVIDTVGYSADGEVEISGRGSPEHFARLYLNNRQTAIVPMSDTGDWAMRIGGIEPGIYTMRVDQVDKTGKVTARFETPFQREDPGIVAAAASAQTPDAQEATPTVAAPEVEAVVAATDDGAENTDGQAVDAASVPTVEPASDASAQPAPVAASAPAAPAPLRVSVVTVQPGFTLWRIARENYGDGIEYVKVYEANKNQIRDPDLIYPGQIFSVPQ